MKKWIDAAREVARIPAYHRELGELPDVVEYGTLHYGSYTRQYIHFARQPNPDAPVAVWWHGGGWSMGDPGLLRAFGDYFYNQGFHVYLPTHRRLWRHGGEAILEDIEKAIGAIIRHADRPDILIGGMSSGGHLAALSATDRKIVKGSGAEVTGLLLCGAPLCLDNMGSSPLRRRLAGSPGTERFRRLNPSAPDDLPLQAPCLIVHGTNDDLVPYRCSEAFYESVVNQGWDRVTLHDLKGGQHLDAARWVLGTGSGDD